MARKSVKKEVSVEELADGDIYEEEETSEPTTSVVTILLNAEVIRPDTREFRQNSVEYVPDEPGLQVAVDIPNTTELIRVLSEGNYALTPAGMLYLQKELEQPYMDYTHSLTQKTKPAEEIDDKDWDEDEPESKNKTTTEKSETSDDDWDEETEDNSTTDDEDWS